MTPDCSAGWPRRAALALALCAAVACGKDAPSPPPAPPPPPAPVSDGLTVLDPGAAPRQVLRYALAPDARSVVELALDLDVDAGGQGGPLPTVKVQSEIAVERALPDGAARVRVRLLDLIARARPGALMDASAMTEQMQLLRDLELAGTLAPDGRLTDLALAPNAAARPPLPPALAQQLDSLRRGLEQLAMPLPTEPVGVGARWTYGKPITSTGVLMHARTTVTLTGVELPRVTFTSTTEVSGADQAVTQAGTTVAIGHIAGTGRGQGTLDLSRLTLTGEQRQELGSEMTAQGETTRMKMVMTTRLGPAPTAADLAAQAPVDAGAPLDAAPAAGDDRATGH